MKKILSLLLCFLLLCGCTVQKTETVNDQDNSYLTKLKTFEPGEKNSALEDNEEYSRFIDEFCTESLKMMDYTSYAGYISYPERCEVKEPEGGLESVEYEFDEESYEFYETYLNKLLEFDYNSLSMSQQYEYEALEYSLMETLCDLQYWKYTRMFSSSSDVVTNIIFMLVDLPVNSETRVQKYLEVIKDIDDYLASMVEFTDKQYEDGIYTSDYALDYSISMLNSIASKKDNNTLIESFDSRIDELDFLSAEKKNEYKEENRDIVLNEVLPAMSKTADEIKSFKGRKESDTMIYTYGSDYLDTYYLLNSSSSDSLDYILNLLIDVYNDMYTKYDELYRSENTDKRLAEYMNDPFFKLECDEMINEMLKKSGTYFEDIGDISFTIDYFDDSLSDTSVLAYYRFHPLDDKDDNVIRVNPAAKNNDEAYSFGATIAHEGIPGHMYNYAYAAVSGLSDVHLFSSFTAFDEGIAMYGEYLLPYILGYDDVADVIVFDYISGYLMNSMLDILINYYAYDSDYIQKNFGISKEYVDYYVSMMADMPGVFIRYGVGFAYIYTFMNNTKEALGDKFDYADFYSMLIKDGSMPFAMLEKKVNDYILDKQ